MNKPRLIDANALIEYVERSYDIYADDIIEMIEKYPTAYDIDKIVEQLEEFYRENECEMNNGFIEVCIDIVKGGVE